MACFSPLHGFKSRVLSDSGKRALVFNARDGYRDLPLTVPCGRCSGCRNDRVNDWLVRLKHEKQFHDRASFLTLTYEDDQLPFDGGLVKSHLQGFMKRLRASVAPRKLRFFACGEYGEQFSRPHYHVILFGEDFSADRVKHSGMDASTLYSSKSLSDLWGFGFASIGSVSSESCRYVASYIFKKWMGEGVEEHYKRVDLSTGEVLSILPEFVVMSRRPGIGSQFFESFAGDVFPSDFVVVDGVKRPVPTFYDKRLAAESPAKLERVKRKRIRDAVARRVDSTPERLAVRKEVFDSRRSLFSKRKLG